MPRKYKPKPLRKYPRMSDTDAQIWSSFLIEHGNEYDHFEYDVRVGTGVNVDQNIPARYIDDFRALTQKRIDAVGFRNNGVDIFEVKQRAGLSALGQLNAYQALFQQSFPNIPVLALILVCSFATDEELMLYKRNKIKVYVYPPQQPSISS